MSAALASSGFCPFQPQGLLHFPLEQGMALWSWQLGWEETELRRKSPHTEQSQPEPWVPLLGGQGGTVGGHGYHRVTVKGSSCHVS